MENLRWILIFAGVAILILLYFSGRPRQAVHRDDDKHYGGARKGSAQGAASGDTDPLLGEEPLQDDFGTFDDVDPDDFIRPGTKPVYQDYPADYAFDDLDQRPASGGGFSSFAQKIEEFSDRLSPRRRQMIAASEPADLHDESVNEGEHASKILTLHVVAPPNTAIPGEQLLELFERRGYHYGEMSIFHSMHNGAIVFSIAKMIEPGYFDINNIESFETPGITLILQLPGPVPADVAFEVLVSEAFEMGNDLGATVLDEHRSTLTKQTVQHMREGIYEYMHREKYFGSVSS